MRSSASAAVASTLLVAAIAFAQPATEAMPPTMALEPAETIRLWEGAAPGALGTEEQDIPVVAWWPAKQLHPWTVECRRWLGTQGF